MRHNPNGGRIVGGAPAALTVTCAAVVLALVTLAACAQPGGGGAPGPSDTGITVTGTVTASPGCPGPQRLDSPCPDRPVAGATVDLSAGGTTVASTTTDASGQFRMVVPAGDYQITAHNPGYRSQATKQITVSGPTTVTLVVDSGMR